MVKDMLVPMDHRPERIIIKDDYGEVTYEESQKVYKERRKIIKQIEKDRAKGTVTWNSSVMGTYKKMTEDEVHEKYKTLVGDEEASTDEIAEKLMHMDQVARQEKPEIGIAKQTTNE
jgi:hypothetical protein